MISRQRAGPEEHINVRRLQPGVIQRSLRGAGGQLTRRFVFASDEDTVEAHLGERFGAGGNAVRRGQFIQIKRSFGQHRGHATQPDASRVTGSSLRSLPFHAPPECAENGTER